MCLFIWHFMSQHRSSSMTGQMHQAHGMHELVCHYIVEQMGNCSVSHFFVRRPSSWNNVTLKHKWTKKRFTHKLERWLASVCVDELQHRHERQRPYVGKNERHVIWRTSLRKHRPEHLTPGQNKQSWAHINKNIDNEMAIATTTLISKLPFSFPFPSTFLNTEMQNYKFSRATSFVNHNFSCFVNTSSRNLGPAIDGKTHESRLWAKANFRHFALLSKFMKLIASENVKGKCEEFVL